MNGDKIVAVIAVIGMLALVVPRLASSPSHQPRLWKMAGLWILIIAVITVAIIALR